MSISRPAEPVDVDRDRMGRKKRTERFAKQVSELQKTYMPQSGVRVVEAWIAEIENGVQGRAEQMVAGVQSVHERRAWKSVARVRGGERTKMKCSLMDFSLLATTSGVARRKNRLSYLCWFRFVAGGPDCASSMDTAFRFTLWAPRAQPFAPLTISRVYNGQDKTFFFSGPTSAGELPILISVAAGRSIYRDAGPGAPASLAALATQLVEPIHYRIFSGGVAEQEGIRPPMCCLTSTGRTSAPHGALSSGKR